MKLETLYSIKEAANIISAALKRPFGKEELLRNSWEGKISLNVLNDEYSLDETLLLFIKNYTIKNGNQLTKSELANLALKTKSNLARHSSGNFILELDDQLLEYDEMVREKWFTLKGATIVFEGQKISIGCKNILTEPSFQMCGYEHRWGPLTGTFSYNRKTIDKYNEYRDGSVLPDRLVEIYCKESNLDQFILQRTSIDTANKKIDILTQEKRELVLLGWLAGKGIDTSRKLEHFKRHEVWEELKRSNSDLFRAQSKDHGKLGSTPEKFFKIQKICKFKD